MHGVTLGVITAVVVLSGLAAEARAAAPVLCDPRFGSCVVSVTSSPTPASSPSIAPAGNASSGGGGCSWQGVPADCFIKGFGWFSASDGCYYQRSDHPLPASDPQWGGHYPAGAIYDFTCVVPGTSVAGTNGGVTWLANPPAGLPAVATPAQLARQALATLKLPRLVVGRSPAANNSDNGVPYTWVNLWTWWWATPATWRPLSATATAGAQWATVTVTPTILTIDPGDGAAAVTCTGPGRPWQPSDAGNAPSNGGCGYRYRHITPAGPLTAVMSVEWLVTWRGAGGTSGTLPVMRTQAQSRFAVEQIQVVNR